MLFVVIYLENTKEFHIIISKNIIKWNNMLCEKHALYVFHAVILINIHNIIFHFIFKSMRRCILSLNGKISNIVIFFDGKTCQVR